MEDMGPPDSWFSIPVCTDLVVFGFIFVFVDGCFLGKALQNGNDVRTAISLLTLVISEMGRVRVPLQWFMRAVRNVPVITALHATDCSKQI